jgi:hypothetical protein
MVKQIEETVRTTHWACAVASTVAADRTLMLMTKNYNCRYVKWQLRKACITRVICRPSVTVMAEFRKKWYVLNPISTR